MSLHAKVDNAVQAVESFSTLLDRETAALKASDYKTFADLQEPKILMAQAYQDAVLAFEEDLDAVKSLEDSLKDKLRAVHTRYAAAMDANLQTLKTTKNVAERIVKLIMDAARRSVSDGPSYSARGIQGISEKIPVHFKLNEQI